jgi:hypothetical protein
MAKEKSIIQQIKEVEVDRGHLEERFTRDRETSSQLAPLRDHIREEEDIAKWERPGKKLEPWPKTGSAGDASWKPYACKGMKRNKSDLYKVRCDIRRHFNNKKNEYQKDRINELAMNSKKNIRDLYRGIN